MNLRLLIVPETIKEKHFLAYIESEYDVRGYKINKINLHRITTVIRSMEDYQERWAFYIEVITKLESFIECRMRGQPDFFLYGKKSFSFCEFKSNGDKLSNEQLFWFEQNKDLPLSVAIAFNTKKYLKDKYNEDTHPMEEM